MSFEGDGLLARCLQHETDHTLGTVFGDRLSAKSRKRLTKQHDAEAEDYPLTWPAPGPSDQDLRITRENARFQQWEALLTNRSKRHRNRELLVQGVRPITRAVEEGWTVRALLRADGAGSAWSDGLWASTDAERVVLSPDLHARLSGKDGAELVAVVEMPDDGVARLADSVAAARPGRGLRPSHQPGQHRHPGPLRGRVRRRPPSSSPATPPTPTTPSRCAPAPARSSP